MTFCTTINEEQAAVAFRLLPWPGKRPARIDIGATRSGYFACRLMSAKKDIIIEIDDAATPERAVVRAVEQWLLSCGSDETVARALSQRFSN